MALVQLVGQEVTAGSTNTVAVSSTTAGNLLVAFLHTEDAGTSTFTMPANWVQIALVNAGGDNASALYYYKNNVGGITSVACQRNASNAFPFYAVIAEYSGIDTTAPLDVSASTNGNSTSAAPGSMTTTNAADLLIVVAGSDGPGSFSSVTSGWAIQHNPTHSAYAVGFADRTVAATAAYSPAFTSGVAGFWGAIQASFKTAGAAAVSPVTPEIVKSLTYQPKAVVKPKPAPYRLPLEDLGYLAPSGTISAQAGLGIGVNAAAVTVQTAYSIQCQPGLGVGVNAPVTTLQTAYTISPAAGLGIGVNAPTATVQTAYAVSASAGVGIGVLAPVTTLATAYTLGMQAGLGIGVLANLTINGGSTLTAQAGLGVGVNAPAVTVQTAYAILCNPGLGIGIGQNITVKTAQAISAAPGLGIGVSQSAALVTAYRLGMVAGLGVGVVSNLVLQAFGGVPFSVTPIVSGALVRPDGDGASSLKPDGYTGASRRPNSASASALKPDGYTNTSIRPDAYTGVKR